MWMCTTQTAAGKTSGLLLIVDLVNSRLIIISTVVCVLTIEDLNNKILNTMKLDSHSRGMN